MRRLRSRHLIAGVVVMASIHVMQAGTRAAERLRRGLLCMMASTAEVAPVMGPHRAAERHLVVQAMLRLQLGPRRRVQHQRAARRAGTLQRQHMLLRPLLLRAAPFHGRSV